MVSVRRQPKSRFAAVLHARQALRLNNRHKKSDPGIAFFRSTLLNITEQRCSQPEDLSGPELL